jgi:hypothetical protein
VAKEVKEVMKFRTTLIAAILLLLSGLYVYVFEFRWPQEKAEREEQAKKIFPVEWEDLRGIRITGSQGTVVLEKKEGSDAAGAEPSAGSGGWRLVEPVRADADDTAVGGLVSALRDVQQEQVIVEGSADLAPFGLQEPEIRIELFLREGKEAPPVLLLGGKSPVGQNSYAMQSGKDAVLLLNTFLNQQVDKSLYDLREKKLFRVKKDDIEKVEIFQEGRPFMEMVREGDDWNLVGPIRAPIARAAADKILDKIAGLRAQSFVSETGEGLAMFGLAHPRREVVVTLAPDHARASLRIGNSRSESGKTLMYAKRGETPEVVSLNDDLLETIDIRPEDLREKKVFPFQSWKVDQANLTWNGQDVTLERRGTGKWWMTRPVDTQASSSAVTSFLSDLSQLEGTAFFEKPQDAEGMKKYGLENPLARVTLFEEKMTPGQADETGATPSPIGTLLLGKADGAQGRTFACLEGGKTVAEVGEDFYRNGFPRDVDSLREKRLLDFYRYQAGSLEFRGPEGEVTLEKRDNAWKLLKPSSGSVDEKTMNELLGFLSDLKLDRFVETAVTPPPETGEDPYGLESAGARLCLKGDDGEEIGTVLFSTRGPRDEPEFRYVQKKGEKEVGLIGADREERLFDKMKEIAGKKN